MIEHGISPPSRADDALAELASKALKRVAGYIQDMDKWFQRLQAALPKVQTYAAIIDPAAVAAFTTAEQTFSVPGLNRLDLVLVNKPTLTAGLGIAGSRASATDTLGITFVNATAAPIDAGSETYLIVSIRR